MLSDIIKLKTQQWLSGECKIQPLLSYIKNKGALREAQIEAIEVYLFLKIKGDNQPLWQLFSQGFFIDEIDLSTLNINQATREYLENNINALALLDFASQKIGQTTRLPTLEQNIISNPSQLDYDQIIKDIFYGIDYCDYLLSLPMGAGKTYLMAAFIYLDLYFAQNEPDNKNFAHNFLVLIPSGLKTSIAPSLRTIKDFDPAWVIPEPSASLLNKRLKFDILDEQKTANKSAKTNNPNSQKVSECLPDPFGQIFIVNAEKVIIKEVGKNPGQLEIIKKNNTLKENELRGLIGKIPNLSILIDEVHHASNAEIKLRKVVNEWNTTNNITTVLGFSGTPYLSSAEKIPLNDNDTLKISEITNTVYHYPLITAIEKFLKKPVVKIADNLEPLQIIKTGIEDFNQQYKHLIYKDGTLAKLVIYCADIASLEEVVYPFLQNELAINADEILRFHGGNNRYVLPVGNALAFKSLDLPLSTKRYILLVGIGKEGWDCKSLTSVILPQKSKSSSKNSIVQTACRCLREVIKGNNETALIWLNRENANLLNSRLQKEHQTSIETINTLDTSDDINKIARFSRMEMLKLPKIDYCQLKISYQSINEQKNTNTQRKLKQLLANINQYKNPPPIVNTTNLVNLLGGELDFIINNNNKQANFNHWLFDIAKNSFNSISTQTLHQFKAELMPIFAAITQAKPLCFNTQFDHYQINSQIRLAFSIKRDLKTTQELIPKSATLLLVDKLVAIKPNTNIYPNPETSKQIVAFDKNPLTEAEFDTQKQQQITKLTQAGKFDEVARVAGEKIDPIIKDKNKTFHFLPYHFDSEYEQDFLKQTLRLTNFNHNNLEIYFNGERGLSEFVIHCFAKSDISWSSIGKYTPDFLILKRTEKDKIHKVLIIETKGEVYAEKFKPKKTFITDYFLSQNNQQYGYDKFDFLYLADSQTINENLATLNTKINQFFS